MSVEKGSGSTPELTRSEAHQAEEAAAEEAGLPTVVGDVYAVEGEQGRGGVGRVFRARDRRLGRMVALKQLQRHDAASRRRFLREARITARLEHPGIVPIHDAGRWPSGEVFYAMRLVEGRTLKEAIASAGSLKDRLALLPRVEAAVEAIAYAHERGVIHRDLKPSNVVLGDGGETVVLDWGLAKDLGAEDEPGTDGLGHEAVEATREFGRGSPGSSVTTPRRGASRRTPGERLEALKKAAGP